MEKKLRALALLAILFFVATASYAQFFQGTKTIGGGIGFTHSKIKSPGGRDVSQRSFNLNLAGGYLVQDNIEAGLRAGYFSGTTIQNNPSGEVKGNSNIFSVGSYARLYNPITDVVGLFGQAGVNVGFGNGSDDTKVRTFDFGISPGIILMVNENLGLEVTVGNLGYSRHSSGSEDNFEDDKTTTSTFNFRLDLSDINFGFRLYLRD